jgi:hypothetical protein
MKKKTVGLMGQKALFCPLGQMTSKVAMAAPYSPDRLVDICEDK